MQWFRMYGGTLNNPKAQKLSGDLFKAWVNLLCVTSQCDGVIVTCDIPFNLRTSQTDADVIMKALVDAELMVKHDGYYVPKDWDERQFKSDTSADRTKRYREKKKEEKCDVTENVTVTPPDTDTDTDTEQRRKKEARAPKLEKPSDVSESVWEDFKTLRKAKKATITETAIAGIRQEAEKAGISLDDALREMCCRGWQGFKAEWYLKKGNENAATIGNSPRLHGNKSERARAAIFEGLGLSPQR